jgi:hypothetical protein
LKIINLQIHWLLDNSGWGVKLYFAEVCVNIDYLHSSTCALGVIIKVTLYS